MSEEKDRSLFQKDRRKNFREEWNDRRQALRPTKHLTRLRIIVAAVFLLLGYLIIFLINPKV